MAGVVGLLFLLPATALAAAPTVSTRPADTITATSAWLNGVVNANDHPATWWFEYASHGEFTRSGGTYPHATPSQLLGFQGVAPLLFVDSNVSRNVSGLASGTKYHFRVAASNSDGTSYGADLTFTTQ